MMADKTIEAIERLEELAAWHRAIAERAGSAWVWEARLLAAEDLERRAADARARLQSGKMDIGGRDAFHAETNQASATERTTKSRNARSFAGGTCRDR